jgi:hypothetical protein
VIFLSFNFSRFFLTSSFSIWNIHTHDIHYLDCCFFCFFLFFFLFNLVSQHFISFFFIDVVFIFLIVFFIIFLIFFSFNLVPQIFLYNFGLIALFSLFFYFSIKSLIIFFISFSIRFDPHCFDYYLFLFNFLMVKNFIQDFFLSYVWLSRFRD